MKTIKARHINFCTKIIALIILFSGIVFAGIAVADGCKPTTCPTTCSAAQTDCNKKLDANCVAEQNKNIDGGSCFNNVPVTSTSGISPQCTSSGTQSNSDGSKSDVINTESGTNFPINSSGNEQVYVKAAAKGKVVFAGVTVDGGRTVIIEHTKSCTENSHGDSGKYHTIYRHLQSINVSMMQEVDINTPIGIAGGSTANEAGSICDNKSQSSLPGYTDSGCSTAKADDIHLNFEVVDGPASGSKTAAASAAGLNSNCNDIQSFCGSCTADLSSCKTENPNEYREITTESINVNANAAQNGTSAKAACQTGLNIDPENCIFCGLFKDIFNSASAISKIANDGLAGPTKKLVGIGFFIWLAIFVLRNITSFGGAKTSDLIKGIIFQGFRVTVIMLILDGALYQVMDLTINPILQTGLSFTRSISASETTTCPADAEYLQGIIGYDSDKGISASSEGGLSKQVGIAFVCSIKKFEDSVTKLMSYGHYSTCLSFKDFPSLGIIPHAGFLTTGAFLYVVGAVLLIMFPWFLIDCLLQLCITVALLPCAIGAFAFKITAKYLKTLWSYFMNAMFNFVFISIIIFIITANFKNWLGYDFNSNDINPDIFINASGNGLAWWGTTAFRILGICFFCWIFLDEAKGMAAKFADAPTLGGGKGIGTMMGGVAASAGFAATKAGIESGGKLFDVAGESLNSFMGSEAQSFSNHTKGMLLGMTGAEKVTDANGNVTAYKRSGKMFGREYNIEYKQDDAGVWSSTVQNGNKETFDDTILSTKVTKNKQGEVVGITSDAKTTSSKYLINADKTINTTAFEQIMGKSSNKEYAARHIVSTVMADRGMKLDDKFLSSETKINDDGSVTITQKNMDGKIQTVNAHLDGNKMMINSSTSDGTQNQTQVQTPQFQAAPETGSVGPEYAEEQIAPADDANTLATKGYQIQQNDGKATSVTAKLNGKNYTITEKDLAGYTHNGQKVTLDMIAADLQNSSGSSFAKRAIASCGRDEQGRKMSIREITNLKNS